MSTSNNTNKYSIYSPVSIPDGTLSTSYGTGDLLVTGGVGVGDTINIQNSIGSLGYMYNSSTVGTQISTNVKVVNNRIRTSRANANNCVSNWTVRSSAADNGWESVCWSSELGIFVAVSVDGAGNRVMTSSNGITWASRTSAANNGWRGICWSPELGIFVAVADTGTGNRVMSSPDGINWTIRTSAADISWTSICWSPELSIFVAVAYTGTGNRVMTSSNGTTWTIRVSAADNQWWGVCWSPELGIFVAVAGSGTGNRVMTSSDGINWSVRSTPADNSWRGICWSPELSIFVAIADSGAGNRVMTSPDGVIWTTRVSAADNGWIGICWSPDLSIFVATSWSGTGNRVMSSPNGINWTTRVNSVDNNWVGICWSSELSIFVAIADSTGSGNRVMTSAIGLPAPKSTLLANPSYINVNSSTGIVNIPGTLQLPANSSAVSSTSGALTLQGDLHLYNPTKNTIVFRASSLGAPATTNRSAGSRIVIYPSILANATDYAIGMDAGTIWYSTNLASEFLKFYCGTTLNMTVGNGSVTIPTNTASTSSSSGSLVVTGGFGIGGAVYSAGINNISSTTQLATNANAVSATSGALTLQGDLHLYNGSKNTIVFPFAGVAPPSYTNRSVGTRLVLYTDLSAGGSDFAIGIESSSIWYSVSATNYNHRFYAGTTLYTTIGNGRVTIPLNVSSTSSSTGSLVVAGGFGVGENINIGGSVVVGAFPGTVRPLTITKPFSQGMLSIQSSGDVRYHVYNDGGIIEWLWGQRSASDHPFRISSLNNSVDTLRFTITQAGSVGIGNTVGPYGTLHMAANSTDNNIVIEAGNVTSGDVPGFTAINFNGYYSTGQQRINTAKNRWRIYCDQSGGNDNMAFEIWNGTSTRNPFIFYSSGYTGINTGPNSVLHIRGYGNTHTLWVDSGDNTIENVVRFTKTQAFYYTLRLDSVTNSTIFFYFVCNGVYVGSINNTNSSTSYNSASDYRLKENLRDYNDAYDEVISKLKVREFNFKAVPNETIQGFLAHEVEQVFPEIVSGKKDAVDSDGKPAYQMIDPRPLIPAIVRSVQEFISDFEGDVLDIDKRINYLANLIEVS